ncbi:MAG: YaeQ family protein [Thiobacillus sp.]|nr:YaeQ family protein [Thiobacillus sp.]
MALKAILYKADLQIADMDRHVYGNHALTIARHPSAYALYAQEGIAFTKGLFDVNEPEVWVKDLTGEIRLWIDLGQPDEARIRRACSRADQVVVLCYSSGCEVWWKQIAGKLTRFANLTVLRLPAGTSQALATLAGRNMRLQCLVQDGEIWINTDTASVAVKLRALQSAS